MALQTVEAIVGFLSEVPSFNSPLSIVWHAGEPLVAGIDFYRKAFAHFAPLVDRGVIVHQSIQTNATLINDSWCELFKKFDVHVGVSVDGPKSVHDAARKDWRNRGSFDRVMAGIMKLQEHGINFSVIAVLPKASLERPEEIWRFFIEHGMRNLNFNPEEAEGANTFSSLDCQGIDEQYEEFLTKILELASREPNVTVREIEEAALPLLTSPGSQLRNSESCIGSILNFDVDGNVSTFSPELLTTVNEKYGSFSFGNATTTSYADFIGVVASSTIANDIATGVDLCRETCDYFSVCGGGSPSNKLIETGSFVAAETLNCRLRVKASTRVLLRYFEEHFALRTGSQA